MESFINECKVRGLDTSKVDCCKEKPGALATAINWGAVTTAALQAFLSILENLILAPAPAPAPPK